MLIKEFFIYLEKKNLVKRSETIFVVKPWKKYEKIYSSFFYYAIREWSF